MDEFGYQQQTKLHTNDTRRRLSIYGKLFWSRSFKSHNNTKNDNYTKRNKYNKHLLKLISICLLGTTTPTFASDIGGVSILINSAAHDERHEMDSVTSEYWDNRMNANIKHFFFASQTCSKMMKNNGGGTIVNIGSFSWMMGIGGMICYTTAKSAVSGLTRSLARELGEYNIRVNCVVPGWIMTKRQLDLWVTPEVKKQQLEKQCLKRLLEPDEIAKAILFFASDDSSATSAQNFVFDGGIVN